jgi:hypothetical protein
MEQDEEVSEQEAERFRNRMHQLAQEWHQRLANPVLQSQLKEGLIELSPMIEALLEAFPQEGT